MNKAAIETMTNNYFKHLPSGSSLARYAFFDDSNPDSVQRAYDVVAFLDKEKRGTVSIFRMPRWTIKWTPALTTLVARVPVIGIIPVGIQFSPAIATSENA